MDSLEVWNAVHDIKRKISDVNGIFIPEVTVIAYIHVDVFMKGIGNLSFAKRRIYEHVEIVCVLQREVQY